MADYDILLVLITVSDLINASTQCKNHGRDKPYLIYFFVPKLGP